jgi:hypothetical protein
MGRHSIAVAGFVLGLAAMALAADDPFVGTWKLNVGKSTITGPPPKSDVTKTEAVANGLKFQRDIVGADGKATHSAWTYILDGKDHPNSRPGESRACTRDNFNTFHCVIKKDGMEIRQLVDVISKDGKTGTLTAKGKEEQGEITSTVLVFERQ